jgi:hypothetical protein
MTPIKFHAPDGFELDVALHDETMTALLGELRIMRPLLAGKVEDAIRNHLVAVALTEDEVEYLTAAANVVSKSDRVDDTELDRIAQAHN